MHKKGLLIIAVIFDAMLAAAMLIAVLVVLAVMFPWRTRLVAHGFRIYRKP